MPSNPSVERLARRLNKVEKDVFNASTQPQLPYSSIDGGSLTLNDEAGNPQGVMGEQWDGTNTFASVGGTPPSPPSVPLVTPEAGGLTIYWDGTYVDDSVARMDFKRVTLHAVLDVDDFDAVDSKQIVGEINTATGGTVSATLPPVEHFVFAVTWTDSGKFSVESDVAFGTPLNVVDQEQFNDLNDQIGDINTSLEGVPEVFRQPEQPVLAAGKKGVWFDTDDSNTPWFNDGTGWTKFQYGAGALAANAVIAETIAAGALNGKTITGPLIQTVSTALRGIKLVDNNLLTYDPAGDVTFAINGSTGIVAAKGALLVGGTITGPTIQTSDLANRGLKIVGNVLSMYDSTGVARLVANGNTGDISMVGKVKTSASNSAKRLEIGTDTDFSKVTFFSGDALEESPGSISSSGPGTLYLTSGSRTDVSGPTTAGINLFAQTPSGKSSIVAQAQSSSVSGTTGGHLRLGQGQSSVAPNAGANLVAVGASGSTMRDLYLSSDNGEVLLGTGIAVRAKVSSTGLAVTGKLSASEWQWQAYTPTLIAGGTKGNGTLTGAYCARDGVVEFYMVFTLGTTSSIAASGSSPGYVSFSLPLTPVSSASHTGVDAIIGDFGTTTYLGLCILSGSNVQVWNYTTSGAYAGFAALNSTAPMTWATNDTIEVRGSYRYTP